MGGRGGQGRAKPPLRREDIGHIYSDEMLAQSDTRHPVAPDLRLAVARALAHLGEIELEYWDRVPEAEQLFQRAPHARARAPRRALRVGRRRYRRSASGLPTARPPRWAAGSSGRARTSSTRRKSLSRSPPPPYLMLPLPMSLLYTHLCIEERQHCTRPRAGGPRWPRGALPLSPPTSGLGEPLRRRRTCHGRAPGPVARDARAAAGRVRVQLSDAAAAAACAARAAGRRGATWDGAHLASAF